MTLGKRATAEFLGTFWLVLGGCGSAVLAAAFPALGIGFAGVSLAFGLTLLTMAFAIGPISGCHINPAVTIGLVAGKRFPASELVPYVVAQVLGGIAGAGVLYLIASGKAGFDLAGGFASNGYGEHSPGGYSLQAALVCEVVMTFMFLLVILGRDGQARAGRLRRNSDRSRADAHPSRQHPGDEHVGEPRAQHGPGDLRRRMGALAAVALLGRADHRRGRRGRGLQRPLRKRLTHEGEGASASCRGRRALAAGLFALAASGARGLAAAAEAVSPDGRFSVSDAMIPMRDGVRLHTKIFTPKEAAGPLPIILLRTPYGVEDAAGNFKSYLKALAEDGYIFAFQDIRGKFGSEGVFVMQRPARASRRHEVARRGNGHLGHDRLAGEDAAREQRPRGDARHLVRGLDHDHGRPRAAPGAARRSRRRPRRPTCGSATTSITTGRSG